MLSRRWWVLWSSLAACTLPGTLAAQDDQPPERIDILVPPEEYEGPLEDCSQEEEAAAISGEIVVCRRRPDPGQYGYDKERAERRYANKTMNKGNPQTPDLFGIPNHGIVVGRGCFIPPCPPPKALIIDVEALPEAPPGSDADRIARGLAPRGKDTATQAPARRRAREDELGLPPPPDAEAAEPVNPSGSASPEAEPSD